MDVEVGGINPMVGYWFLKIQCKKDQKSEISYQRSQQR